MASSLDVSPTGKVCNNDTCVVTNLLIIIRLNGRRMHDLTTALARIPRGVFQSVRLLSWLVLWIPSINRTPLRITMG